MCVVPFKQRLEKAIPSIPNTQNRQNDDRRDLGNNTRSQLLVANKAAVISLKLILIYFCIFYISRDFWVNVTVFI